MYGKIESFFSPESSNGRYLQICLVSLILLAIMTVSVSNKQIGHIDEFLSYSLSNSGYMGRSHTELFEKSLHWYAYDMIKNGNESRAAKTRDTIWRVPLLFFMFDGEKTSLSKEETKNIMMPSDDAKFNFASVLWNQSFDVHPPLFYMALNTVCSVFYNDGEFSPWHGLAVNLFFFFLTLPVIYYIMYFISKRNHGLSILAMTVYALIAGGTVAFLRMYMMLTFFTALYTLLVLPFFYGKISTFNKIILGAVIVLGSLSHHYFLVYMGISGMLIFLYLLFKRQKNLLFNFIGIFALATAISFAIFPFTVVHMFFNEHGAGDILYKLSNMSGLEAYLKYILQYFGFLGKAIFGVADCIPLIVLFLGFVFIYFRKNIFEETVLPSELIFFVFTVIFYVAFVAITTKYQAERYIMNVYPVVSILLLYFFHLLYKSFHFRVNLKPIFILILLAFMSGNFEKNMSEYLYLGGVRNYTVSDENKNIPCIYAYDENEYSFFPRFASFMFIKELGDYSEVKFVKYYELNEALSKLKEKSAIVYFCSYKDDKYDGYTADIENILKNAAYPYTMITSERGCPVYKLNLKN